MENRDNPLSGKNFSLPVFFETQRRMVPYEMFRYCGANNFDGKSERGLKNRKDRAPSLPYQFWVPEIYETVKDSPMKFFDTMIRKVFDGKS